MCGCVGWWVYEGKGGVKSKGISLWEKKKYAAVLSN